MVSTAALPAAENTINSKENTQAHSHSTHVIRLLINSSWCFR